MRALNGVLGKKLANIGGRAMLKASKYSPEILLGIGITGMVTAGVMAVSRVRNHNANMVYSDHQLQLGQLQERANPDTVVDENYPDNFRLSPKQYKLEKLKLYARTGMELGHIYWRPLALGAASIGCIISGHVVMKRRYVGVMAAYGLVQEAFDTYRKRVREELGEDADRKFMYNTEEKTTVKEIIDEDGRKKKLKEKKQVLMGREVSQYAVIFDRDNPQWSEGHRDYNWFFIKKKLQFCNDILHSRGHIFLNEVYDELGFPHTKAGSVVGWVKRSDGGDNYITFGPWCETIDQVEESDAILLDFNVDGIIWNLI